MSNVNSLDVKHPLYIAMVEDWQMMDDSLSEKAVKKAGIKYLPATRAMRENGLGTPKKIGEEDYQAYKTRAIFFEIVSVALEAMVGLLNKKQINIKVPPALEPMLENFTKRGHSVYDFHRNINEGQLLMGRIGLLVDVPDDAGPDALPYVVAYDARSIINWDDVKPNGQDKLTLVTMDESRVKFNLDSSSWDRERRFKMLRIDSETGQYVTVDEVDGLRGVESIPSLAGNSLNELPFVFCGSNDTNASPDAVPLISLARMAFAIYRGDADYRHSLFMQGQDTLVTIGGSGRVVNEALPTTTGGNVDTDTCYRSPEIELGAGAHIHISDKGGDAKFIGVESKGLEEQRESLNDLHKRAGQMGSQLVENTGNIAEAAEALKIRLKAHTSSLTQIALTSAQAIKEVLGHAARFKGIDTAGIEVTPNLDFDDLAANVDEINKLIDAKVKGAPISMKSLHKVMVGSGVSDMTYEKEIEEIEDEGDGLLIPPRMPSGVSTGLEPGAPGKDEE